MGLCELGESQMTRHEAHEACLSRDCGCIAGKDRDNNYHETIDTIYAQIAKLEQQVAYWKLSFNKQVEANRGH